MSGSPFNEKRVPAVVTIYRPSGAVRSVYQIGSGSLIGVNFTLDRSGPESFSISAADYLIIEKKDIIEIRIFSETEPFFKGVVRNVPIKGSSDVNYVYSGFGLSEYFGRINTESQSYSSELVEDIVKDIAENIIAAKTPVLYSAAKIDATGVTVTSIDFDYIQADEAIKQLKELAQGSGYQFITGVDEDGYFFFKKRSEEVQKTLVVGKNSDIGIPYYNPSDENEARTKYFIKKKDGTFYGTVQSTIENDIFEETLTAPDIDDDDLTAWATGILIETETNTRKATIEWQIETVSPTFLKGDGKLRVISNVPNKSQVSVTPSSYGSGTYNSGVYGGEQSKGLVLDDTLRIISVSYEINNNTAKRIIQLGLDDPNIGLEVLSIRNELKGLKVSLGV